jgi:hypothetical protein
MGLRRTPAFALAALIIASANAAAQSATAELSTAGGTSTVDGHAAAAQLRLFGEVATDFRFYLEGAWGSRSDSKTDAFGAAYPYDKRVRPIEMYGEKIFRGETLLAGVRVGRYRSPFGIYGRGDHAYSGFLRPPFIRYDGYWALSNNYLEGGVDLFAGTPALQIETSFGVPQDVGSVTRRRGLDRVFRVQGYRGPMVVGVSHARSRPYERRSFAQGEAIFTGVDVRVMAGGAQFRGEWITGQPWEGPSTTGWYVDARLHRPALGPLTLIARFEDFDYDAGRRSRYHERYTAGARVQLSPAIVGDLNVIHDPRAANRFGVDAALTWVIRHPW